MASQELSAQVRTIIAAEPTPACFADLKEQRKIKAAQRQFAMGKMPDYSSSGNTRQGTDLKWTMSNHPTTKLGAAFWTTRYGRHQIRGVIEALEDEISDRFPSARNTSQTLKTDLAEIIASDYLSKQVGFEHLTQFMDAVLVSADGEFAPWEHLYAYLRIYFKTNTIPDELYDQGLVTIKALQQQWSSHYVGQSLDALKDKLKGYHRSFERNEGLYARIMPIIQSSGTGKSRLVNELAGSVLGIAFTLRENGSTGYPPGDPEVVQFLKADLKLDPALEQARIICFLGAAITIGMTQEYSDYGRANMLALMYVQRQESFPKSAARLSGGTRWHHRMDHLLYSLTVCPSPK
jgi:hypothetical protein